MFVLGVMVASIGLYGAPGALLYPLLHRHGFDFITSVGLELAGLTVLYSALASIFGYVFWLQLGVTLAILTVLIIANYRQSQIDPIYWHNVRPQLKCWQWLLLVRPIQKSMGCGSQRSSSGYL